MMTMNEEKMKPPNVKPLLKELGKYYSEKVTFNGVFFTLKKSKRKIVALSLDDVKITYYEKLPTHLKNLIEKFDLETDKTNGEWR